MTEEQKECLDVVEKINEELFQKYDKLDKLDSFKDWHSIRPILSCTIADYMILISLSIPSEYGEVPEIHLYNSENNDRIYYEKSDKYESMYKFIKRKFLEVKISLNEIKL